MPIHNHLILALGLAVAGPTALAANTSATDVYAPLAIYDGEWDVKARHPWSGAAAGALDRLSSHCHRYTAYFACEQTVNGKVSSLIVYTARDEPSQFYTRTIAPGGLAGGRGDLILSGSHWSYIDKPPPSLKGDWSRTDNDIIDADTIHFEEYDSADEGKTWTLTNAGTETRRK